MVLSKLEFVKIWSDWKKKHPRKVMACVKCNKSLSIQNILSSLKFKCYHCKELMLKPTIRDYNKSKGFSGKKKRDWSKLVDSQGRPYPTLNNQSLSKILDANIPSPATVYKPGVYLRILRQNALIALLYLCASRISEITGIKDSDGKYKVFPIKREQIYVDYLNNNKVIIIKNINILKRKEQDIYDEEGQAHRSIPKRDLILLYEHEQEIFKHIEEYISRMDKKKGLDYNLFPICRQTAVNYLKRTYEAYLISLGIPEEQFKAKIPYLHWLRHSRCDYLSIKYKMSDAMLAQYTGWASALMAAKYRHTQAEDLFNVMKQNTSTPTP